MNRESIACFLAIKKIATLLKIAVSQKLTMLLVSVMLNDSEGSYTSTI
jgi:hypothetical protein